MVLRKHMQWHMEMEHRGPPPGQDCRRRAAGEGGYQEALERQISARGVMLRTQNCSESQTCVQAPPEMLWPLDLAVRRSRRRRAPFTAALPSAKDRQRS